MGSCHPPNATRHPYGFLWCIPRHHKWFQSFPRCVSREERVGRSRAEAVFLQTHEFFRGHNPRERPAGADHQRSYVRKSRQKVHSISCSLRLRVVALVLSQLKVGAWPGVMTVFQTVHHHMPENKHRCRIVWARGAEGRRLKTSVLPVEEVDDLVPALQGMPTGQQDVFRCQ